MNTYDTLADIKEKPLCMLDDYVQDAHIEDMNLANGTVRVWLNVDDTFYYDMVSQMLGSMIQ